MPLPETVRRQAERRKLLEAEARRIADQLARDPTVRQVIAFGSAARGDVRSFSDLDMLVVMETELEFIERFAALWRRVRPSVPVDFLVYTPVEFAKLKDSRLFVRQAISEGRILYDADAGTTGPTMV